MCDGRKWGMKPFRTKHQRSKTSGRSPDRSTGIPGVQLRSAAITHREEIADSVAGSSVSYQIGRASAMPCGPAVGVPDDTVPVGVDRSGEQLARGPALFVKGVRTSEDEVVGGNRFSEVGDQSAHGQPVP